MDFALTSEEEAFRREVQIFLEKEIPEDFRLSLMFPAVDTSDKRIQNESREMARKLGKKGWHSITWPKKWGGLEGSHLMEFIYVEEIMYYGGLGYDPQQVVHVAPVLLHFGTDKQKREHLPPLAKGEVIWCQGFSEPDAGSDLASLKTRAIRDGDDFIINGQKVWSSRAHQADWCHVLARTDPKSPKHKGISYFLVNMRSPGIGVNPLNGMYGSQSMCEIFFDNVRVPRENMVGELNQGWSVAMSMLDLERLIYIEQVGVGRRVLEMLVKYANERGMSRDRQVRQNLAEMAVEIDICRLIGQRAAWLIDRGLPVAGECSMGKIITTEWAQRWANTGMQIMGLYGQLSEDSELAQLAGKIQHWYIRSFGLTIAAGTSEIERMILATRGLELPRS